MVSKQADILIVGAGIFGLSTALELSKTVSSICVIDSDTIPAKFASSNDISKVIRIEYGADSEYMDMAFNSIKTWREWNSLFARPLFHEEGFLLLAREEFSNPKQAYESSSLQLLKDRDFDVDRIKGEQVEKRFPAFASGMYADAIYNPIGGFVESAETLKELIRILKEKGVSILEASPVTQISNKDGRVEGVVLQDGRVINANTVIVCAGNHTPRLLPELKDQFSISAHPIFHLTPKSKQALSYPNLTPFSADISNSGWYGFPIHPIHGVVKLARHATGRILDPTDPDRSTLPDEVGALKSFVNQMMPALVDADLTFSAICCYTDSLDGHFWIDKHPAYDNLIVGTGGSGHGFKMGPEIGRMLAAKALGKDHDYSSRYHWRDLRSNQGTKESARAVS